MNVQASDFTFPRGSRTTVPGQGEQRESIDTEEARYIFSVIHTVLPFDTLRPVLPVLIEQAGLIPYLLFMGRRWGF